MQGKSTSRAVGSEAAGGRPGGEAGVRGCLENTSLALSRGTLEVDHKDEGERGNCKETEEEGKGGRGPNRRGNVRL